MFIHELLVEFIQRLTMGRFEQDGPRKGKAGAVITAVGSFREKVRWI